MSPEKIRGEFPDQAVRKTYTFGVSRTTNVVLSKRWQKNQRIQQQQLQMHVLKIIFGFIYVKCPTHKLKYTLFFQSIHRLTLLRTCRTPLFVPRNRSVRENSLQTHFFRNSLSSSSFNSSRLTDNSEKFDGIKKRYGKVVSYGSVYLFKFFFFI